MFIYIEIGGTGGSAFRPMYASFLEETGKILGNPGYHELALAYRAAARGWSDIASAALPEYWPVLVKIKSLMLEKNRIFEEEDSSSLPKLLDINHKMESLMYQAARELDENQDGKRDKLLSDLKEKILRIYEIEREAALKMKTLVETTET